jgi:YVTN family beta-propeller protein
LACGDGATDPAVNAAYLIVRPDSVPLEVAGWVQLEVTVLDEDSAVIADAVPAFRSNDPFLVVVSSAGTVSSAGGIGSSSLTVTSGSASVLVPVAVFTHPEGVLTTSLPLDSRPFGIAISWQGVAYVTQLDAAQLARIDLPALSLSGGVAVQSVPTSVTFDHAGTTAYVSNQFDQSVSVVDVGRDVEIGRYMLGINPLIVTMNPGGTELWVTSGHDWVLGIDVTADSLVSVMQVEGAPNDIVFHPHEEDCFYVSASLGSAVTEFAGYLRRRVFEMPTATPQGLVVSPDGSELYVADEAGPIKVVTLSSGTVRSFASGALGGFGLAQSPGGAVLYMTVPGLGQVLVIDRESGQVSRTISTGGQPRRVAFDLFGQTALVADESGWVHVIR